MRAPFDAVRRALLIALATGLASCGAETRSLGRLNVTAQPANVASLASSRPLPAADAPAAVYAVEGVITEICPSTGCWAYLEDGGSPLRIECPTFTLPRQWLGQRCRVVGRVLEDADTLTLIASGMERLE